jgi:hypothetical protein
MTLNLLIYEENFIYFFISDETHLARGDLGAGESLDDDVVSVVADYDHGEQGEGPKNTPSNGVQVTPWSIKSTSNQ